MSQSGGALQKGRKLQFRMSQSGGALQVTKDSRYERVPFGGRVNKEGGIEMVDRRHVIFCPVHALEAVLSVSSEDFFLSTLKAARNEKYVNWELQEINREEAAGMEIEAKKFPFDLDGVLPWWKDFRKTK